jgi:hypothetical protein
MAFWLEKDNTVSTPYVLVDEEKKYMLMKGSSFNENAVEFFQDINDWLNQYLASGCAGLTFDCEMDYINSSTYKVIINMVKKMDDHASIKNKITINWITYEDNDIMIECGEDFKSEVENIIFNMVVRERAS